MQGRPIEANSGAATGKRDRNANPVEILPPEFRRGVKSAIEVRHREGVRYRLGVSPCVWVMIHDSWALSRDTRHSNQIGYNRSFEKLGVLRDPSFDLSLPPLFLPPTLAYIYIYIYIYIYR